MRPDHPINQSSKITTCSQQFTGRLLYDFELEPNKVLQVSVGVSNPVYNSVIANVRQLCSQAIWWFKRRPHETR